MLISKIKKIEGGRVIVKDSFEEILSLTPHDRFVVLHKGYRIYQNTRTGVYSAIKVKSYSPYGYRGKSLEGVKSEIDSRPKDSRTKDALAGEHYHVEQYAPDMFSVEDPVGESVGLFKTKAAAETECKRQNGLYMKNFGQKDAAPYSQSKIIEKSAEMVWGRKPTAEEIEDIWQVVQGTGEHFWDILKRYLEIHKP